MGHAGGGSPNPITGDPHGSDPWIELTDVMAYKLGLSKARINSIQRQALRKLWRGTLSRYHNEVNDYSYATRY